MPNFFDKYPYTDFHELNLDWILEQIRHISAEWDITKHEWSDTKTFITDFFDNLNLQDEVNNKINEMIADGSMALLFSDVIGFVTPEMYGAKGDGVTDDTASIQQAVDTGRKVMFNPSSTYFCGTVRLLNNSRIDGNNAAFIMRDDILFDCRNVPKVTTTTSAAYTAGVHTIALVDGSLASVGDMIEIQGTALFNKDDQNAYTGGVALVQDLSNDIMLSEPFDFDFPAGTDALVYSPMTVTIENISNIRPKDLAEMYFVYAIHNYNSRLYNINSNYEGFGGIAISGINCIVDSCNLNDTYDRNAYNYVMALAAPSSGCVIKNCTISACWHCISIVGGYPVSNSIIENNVMDEYTSQLAYREHANAKNTIFRNNRASGVYFSHNAIIENNKIYRRYTDATVQCSLVCYDADYVIKNNEFIGSLGVELGLLGDNTGSVKITLKDNKNSVMTLVGTYFSGHVTDLDSDQRIALYDIANMTIDRLYQHDFNTGNLTIPANVTVSILENVKITKSNSAYGCRFMNDKSIIRNVTVDAEAGVTKDCLLQCTEAIVDDLNIDSGMLQTYNKVVLNNSTAYGVNVNTGYIVGKNNLINNVPLDYASNGTQTFRVNVTGGAYVLTAIN